MEKTAKLLALAVVVTFSQGTFGATWYVETSVLVSGDGTSCETAFKTIQEGIDGAGEGDTILVAQGIYLENIQFNGRNIVLRSANPLDPNVVENTVIDGNAVGSVVTFSGSENESCVVSGFTMTNGVAVHGGGIYGGEWPGTKASIRNNRICQNRVEGFGGGLYWCGGRIENNIIVENRAARGGGLSRCDGSILSNFIAQNTATVEGGGLWICGGLIEGNAIAKNCVTDAADGRGGGLYGCNGTVRDNLIVGNSALGTRLGSGGGALYGGSGLILNNTVVENSAAAHGGGLARVSGTVVNCIIWRNSAPENPQVHESSGVNYSCIEGWAGGTGNISVDPAFRDPAGPDHDPSTFEDNDYHLTLSSPCIDTGANGYWLEWPVRDKDGNTRVANHVVDMGCYEFAATPDADGDLLSDSDEHTWTTDRDDADTDGDGIQDGLEVIHGRDPTLPDRQRIVAVPADARAIQQALSLCPPGGEVIVSPGTYVENLLFPGWNLILRSTDPANPQVVESTIIDGNRSGSVIRFTGDEDETTVVSGFTIRSGEAILGGGIYGKHNFARIENNILTDNAAEDGGALNNCTGVIQNNIIWGNMAGRHGGGAMSWCNGTIRNNVITQNSGNRGGAFECCDATIRDNMIAENRAPSSGGALHGCRGLLENNIIRKNTATYDGGALNGFRGVIRNNIIIENSATDGGAMSSCFGTIANNLIAGNSATKRGGGLCWAADVCVLESGSPDSGGRGPLETDGNVILNNTIVANSAGEMGGGICWSFVDCGWWDWLTEQGTNSTSPLSDYDGPVRNNIIWGNSAPIGAQVRIDWKYPQDFRFSCIQDWVGGGEGNIATDPLFLDPDGPDDNPQTYEDNNYRLSPDSPCVDAGDNSLLDPPGLDLDGNFRIAFGGKSLTVDMGAYEYNSSSLTVSHFTLDGTGGFELTWKSQPNESYSIWSCVDPSDCEWIKEGEIRSESELTTWTDPDTAATCKFYKIEIR